MLQPTTTPTRWVVRAVAGVVALSTFSAGVAAAPAPPHDYPDAVARGADTPQVVRRFRVLATAYSSTVDQTDSTPCVTANGYDLCAADAENVVAANFLRFGTRLRIPDYSGEKVYTVQDRMHPRFNRRVDLWMRDRESAKLFGAQYLGVEILE